MPQAQLQGKGTHIYHGFGLLLIVLSQLLYVHLPFGLNVSSAVSALGFAALSALFATVQNSLAFAPTVKVSLAWSYGLGTILTLTSWPWLRESWVTATRDADWARPVGMVDLAFPCLVLLTVAALLRGVLLGDSMRPGRAYLVGGLVLAIASIGGVWFNMFSNHFAVMPDGHLFMANLLWMPASLLVSTAGVMLGCFPPDVYRASRLGSAMVFCYLLVIVLVPFGLYASVSDNDAVAYVALLLITLGVCAPASHLTRNWIVGRPTHAQNISRRIALSEHVLDDHSALGRAEGLPHRCRWPWG